MEDVNHNLIKLITLLEDFLLEILEALHEIGDVRNRILPLRHDIKGSLEA